MPAMLRRSNDCCRLPRTIRKSPTDIIAAVNADDDTKFLARSIALLWYLGSWYKPADLKKAAPSGDLIPSQVVSAKAYTQGLVWQIAQAHPMGYSNLQFGYWSREPVDPNDQEFSSRLHHSNNSLREPTMAANNCIKCDVAIVGSGFAGALIANELSQKGIKVVILEAGRAFSRISTTT